eukprot:1418584-Rhodomonas_salina.3
MRQHAVREQKQKSQLGEGKERQGGWGRFALGDLAGIVDGLSLCERKVRSWTRVLYCGMSTLSTIRKFQALAQISNRRTV